MLFYSEINIFESVYISLYFFYECLTFKLFLYNNLLYCIYLSLYCNNKLICTTK